MSSDSDPSSSSETTGSYLFGDFCLDLDRRRLSRGQDPDAHEAIALSPKAFDLLETLVRHVDQVVPKQALLDEVWADVHVEESVLKVRISEIRGALDEAAADPVHVHTHQRVGYRFAGPVRHRAGSTATASRAVMAFSQRPAVAILPFADFSESGAEDYFADGIVEELTRRLARFRYFPVIARTSTFAYKGRAVDVAQAARELGARYVVEGSAQRSEDRVRITVQLIDGETTHHVWADRFENDFTSLFEINDEITDRIAGAMHSQIYAVEMRRAVEQPRASLDAWVRLLRAWALQDSMDPAENAAAIAQFEAALDLDPRCAQAYSGLAMSHFRSVVHGWSDDPIDAVRATRENAAHSVRCDGQDPYSHLATGVACWLEGKRDELLGSIEHAVWLNPSLAWAHLWGGIAYGVAGDPDRAMAMAERAIQLSPLDPLRGIFDYAIGIAHFSAGRYEPAYEAAGRATSQLPSWGWPYTLLAGAAAFLDRIDEAQAARRMAQERLPGLTIETLASLLPFASPEFIERSVESGRLAGWES